MAKVTINGEVFAWDPFGVRLLSEALFIERVTRTSYAVWADEVGKKLQDGDPGTLSRLLAVTLRRAGHEVSEDAARDGTFLVADKPVDLMALEWERDEGDAPPDPTAEAAPKEASPTTQTSTSPRSASSASGPGR